MLSLLALAAAGRLILIQQLRRRHGLVEGNGGGIRRRDEPSWSRRPRSEGTLNVIALPADWANYGNIIKDFKAKYGIKVNSIAP